MSEKKLIKLSLLDFEKSTALMEESGVTTISLFEGDIKQVTSYVKERFAKIVRTNPWLNGKLVKDKQSKQIVLQFDENPTPEDTFKNLYHPNASSVQISSEMDYASLVKNGKTAIVKKGKKLVNKDEALTRLTIVPDVKHPNEKFALILSISHVIADGHTFYNILSSLSSDEEIVKFNAQRKHKEGGSIASVIGEKQFKYGFSVPLILNVLKGMVFGKKANCYAFYIDDERILKAKDRAKKEGGFVSTNDILTSSFSKTVRARLSMMAINLRNRIDNLKDSDAGNYEGMLLYDESYYSKPENIRKSLQLTDKFETISKPLPGFANTVFAKFAQVSNWASFSKAIKIEGATQVMHLPVYDIGMIPFDCAIIFQPKPYKTAVMYFSKTIKREDILKNCEVNETIDSYLFD